MLLIDGVNGLLPYLRLRDYPGRGVILARPDADRITVTVFLTGRSEASRAREIVRTESSLEVVPTDDAPDDPLRHYFAAIASGTRLVAGDGPVGDSRHRVAGR